MTEVVIKTKMALEQNSLDWQNLLVAAIASFLGETCDSICITVTAIENNSLEIIIKMPKENAKRLLDAYEKRELKLVERIISPIEDIREIRDWRNQQYEVAFIGRDRTHKPKISDLIDVLNSSDPQKKSAQVSGSFRIGKTRFIDCVIDEKSSGDNKVELLAITSNKEKLPLILKQRADFIVACGQTKLPKTTIETKIINLIDEHDRTSHAKDNLSILYVDSEIATSSQNMLAAILHKSWSVSKRKLIVEWCNQKQKDNQREGQPTRKRRKPSALYEPEFDHSIEVRALDKDDADRLITSRLDKRLKSRTALINEITREFRKFCGTHPCLIEMVCKFVNATTFNVDLFVQDISTHLEQISIDMYYSKCSQIVKRVVESISSKQFDAETWIKDLKGNHHVSFEHNGLLYKDEVLSHQDNNNKDLWHIIKLLERIYHVKGRDQMQNDKQRTQRLSRLEELLEILYERLGDFQKGIATSDSVSQKSALKQQIKREILPDLRKYEVEYAQLLAEEGDIILIADAEAANVLAETRYAIERLEAVKVEDQPKELRPLLQEVREKLDDPGKAAAAKLKVTLPIIPLIASYEFELDTEALMVKVWRRIKALFKPKD